MTLSGRQPCGGWRSRNKRVDFRDVSHEPEPNSRGPSGSTQTNNAGIGSITICRSSRSRLLTSNSIPCAAARTTLQNLGIFLRNSRNAGSIPRDRPRDPQPSHPGKQRGSFQSQFRRCALWSTDDPAGLLKCFQKQSAIRGFQGHR